MAMIVKAVTGSYSWAGISAHHPKHGDKISSLVNILCEFIRLFMGRHMD